MLLLQKEIHEVLDHKGTWEIAKTHLSTIMQVLVELGLVASKHHMVSTTRLLEKALPPPRSVLVWKSQCSGRLHYVNKPRGDGYNCGGVILWRWGVMGEEILAFSSTRDILLCPSALQRGKVSE